VEDEVEVQRAKVDEGCEEAPVLNKRNRISLPTSHETLRCRYEGRFVYLTFMPHRPEAVEEIERAENMALYEYARYDRRRRPVARANGHLEEPLFERELRGKTAVTTECVCHCAKVRVVCA
jgi:hypothetical protein